MNNPIFGHHMNRLFSILTARGYAVEDMPIHHRNQPVPPTVSFNVSYDRRTDVLYISTRPADGVDARLDKSGILWRYDDEGELIGATIMDFRDRWLANQQTLAAKLSKRFHLPEHRASVVLDYAFYAAV